MKTISPRTSTRPNRTDVENNEGRRESNHKVARAKTDNI